MNNIANAYMGQKAVKEMSAQIKNDVEVTKQTTLISAIMLRNGVGGNFDSLAQEKQSGSFLARKVSKFFKKQSAQLVNDIQQVQSQTQTQTQTVNQ